MNRKISVSIVDASNRTWPFKGLRELHDFLSDECEYWKKQRDFVASTNSKMHPLIGNDILVNIINTINSWETDLEGWSDDIFNQNINNLNKTYLTKLHVNWLWSGHPFASIFVKSNKEYNITTATSFINILLNKEMPRNLLDPDQFFGSILAYEFKFQDSDLTKRSKSEKVSLEHLRSRLTKTNTKLISEIEQINEKYIKWDNDIKNNWGKFLADTSTEHTSSQATYKNEHTSSQDKYRDEFNQYLGDCNTRISDLENTYREKLRLEEPAIYWNKSARKYRIQGGLFFLALVASVVLGFYYFSNFFTTWLEGKAIGIELNTIQGVILFGTVLAVYAFLVRVISRLTFSSLHLMRDSEEREQLTYLYLALIKDKNIDEKSRYILLQALFSRSETGLLAAESGPTMPGMNEAIKFSARK